MPHINSELIKQTQFKFSKFPTLFVWNFHLSPNFQFIKFTNFYEPSTQLNRIISTKKVWKECTNKLIKQPTTFSKLGQVAIKARLNSEIASLKLLKAQLKSHEVCRQISRESFYLVVHDGPDRWQYKTRQ